jgi:hypothetical protein
MGSARTAEEVQSKNSQKKKSKAKPMKWRQKIKDWQVSMLC